MSGRYYSSCVDWPQHDVHSEGGLCDMIAQAQDITRATFKRHVATEDRLELEDAMGYERHPAKGLIIANDWAVSYHRSWLHNERVYFMRHSAIEYVFWGGAL